MECIIRPIGPKKIPKKVLARLSTLLQFFCPFSRKLISNRTVSKA